MIVPQPSNPSALGRRGAVPLWLPLLAVALLFVAGVRAMERRAHAAGYGWIDPVTLDFGALPSWADARWDERLAARLESLPPFRTDDAERVQALEDALAGLAFVRQARVEEVLWPGGLEVELELREPVACIPVGRHFLPVSDEGVVLPGLWTRPPRVGERFLPVLGPLEDAHGVFATARAGDWLAEARHLDALAIVRSARVHLEPGAAALLGRYSVLASAARQATPDVPGARLQLEDERTIWFGRPPADPLLACEGAPGELPAWAKWDAVSRGLALMDPAESDSQQALDWLVLDVRWDQPELVPRPEVLVALAVEERDALAAAELVAAPRFPQQPLRRATRAAANRPGGSSTAESDPTRTRPGPARGPEEPARTPWERRADRSFEPAAGRRLVR